MSVRTLAAALALALPAGALACGACIEDKIAATYDYAVVTDAAARHHVVVFAAVESAGEPAREARSIRATALRVKGIDRASVRTSDSPRALSFALDPGIATPEAALAEIARQPPLRGVRLSLIRVMR